MIDFLADNFSGCVGLAVFLLAMCPLVESKVAIPFALSVCIWGESALSPICAFFIVLAGCFLPSIFVILFGRFVRNKTSGFVHEKFMKRYAQKLEKLKNKNTTFNKCLTLATFVAVPLPMTGVWTGSLIAGLTNLKIWQCLLSIFVGEMVSCAVVLLLCLVFENSAFYIFLISLVLVAFFLLINLLVFAFGRLKVGKHKHNAESV